MYTHRFAPPAVPVPEYLDHAVRLGKLVDVGGGNAKQCIFGIYTMDEVLFRGCGTMLRAPVPRVGVRYAPSITFSL